MTIPLPPLGLYDAYINCLESIPTAPFLLSRLEEVEAAFTHAIATLTEELVKIDLQNPKAVKELSNSSSNSSTYLEALKAKTQRELLDNLIIGSKFILEAFSRFRNHCLHNKLELDPSTLVSIPEVVKARFQLIACSNAVS